MIVASIHEPCCNIVLLVVLTGSAVVQLKLDGSIASFTKIALFDVALVALAALACWPGSSIPAAAPLEEAHDQGFEMAEVNPLFDGGNESSEGEDERDGDHGLDRMLHNEQFPQNMCAVERPMSMSSHDHPSLESIGDGQYDVLYFV